MSEVVHASQGYVEKTVRTIAAEEVAKLVAGADTNYDTLKEIADYIKGDETGAAELKNKVSALETDKADKTTLEAEERRAKDAESALDKRVKVLETSGGGGSGGGSSVAVVPPSAEGAGKAADAAAVYDALKGKQDALSSAQLAACNSGITAKKVEEKRDYLDLTYRHTETVMVDAWRLEVMGFDGEEDVIYLFGESVPPTEPAYWAKLWSGQSETTGRQATILEEHTYYSATGEKYDTTAYRYTLSYGGVPGARLVEERMEPNRTSIFSGYDIGNYAVMSCDKTKGEQSTAYADKIALEFFVDDEIAKLGRKKQDTLTDEQLAAVNSGITSTAYTTLLKKVSANASAIETLSNTVDLAAATLEDALGEEVGE